MGVNRRFEEEHIDMFSLDNDNVFRSVENYQQKLRITNAVYIFFIFMINKKELKMYYYYMFVFSIIGIQNIPN